MSERKLPNDVSRCNNVDCPLVGECARSVIYLPVSYSGEIVVSHFDPKDEISCDNFEKRFVDDDF